MTISLEQKFIRQILKSFFAILALAIIASAQEPAQKTDNTDVKFIKIKNFGQMDGRFYRGAQPKDRDYTDLAKLGINTIIDLRDDSEPTERMMVEAAGMKYVHIPRVGKKYPTPEATEMFLKTVNDAATGKFFVHCAGGRHRTGAMGAVYRYEFYGWDFDKVYKEMKQYDFYTTWGHGAFKDFVKDYYARIQAGTPKPIQDPGAVKEKQ